MIEKVYEYLKGKVYWLATEEGDQARVRPFGSLAIYEGKLYIATQKGKKVYEQMLTNPKIELGAMGQGGGWIRVDPKSAQFYLKNATVTINKTGGEAPEIFHF